MNPYQIKKIYGWLLLVMLLLPSGCATPPEKPPVAPPEETKQLEFNQRTSRPYTVFGKTYFPMSPEEAEGYVNEGVASWYGIEFHNRPTAIGERYDMNRISGAHTTLPLPIWTRVTNLENGQSLDIRINDRGPFIDDRLIDLSYAAAEKLGYAQQGITKVRVEALSVSENLQLAKSYQIEPYRPQIVTTGPIPEHRIPPPKPPSWQTAKIQAKSSDRKPANVGLNTGKEEKIQAKSSDRKPANVGLNTGKEEKEHFIQVGSFGYYENARQIANRLQTIGNAKVIKSSVGAKIMYRVRLGPYPSAKNAEKTVETLRQMNIDQTQILLD